MSQHEPIKPSAMQMQLPLFPTDTKRINNSVGVREQNGTVYYLHNGSPVFCHEKDDMNSYRYITGNLVVTGLCRCSEIADALGVKRRNIERYAKTLREKGSQWFFNRQEKRGTCYKLDESSLLHAQELIDKDSSVAEAARRVEVTEGALRYHIRKGTIKKKGALR
jgi:biotin operon repressor